MREGEFQHLDMDEIEALASELEEGEGYHCIPYDEEPIPHKPCVSCHCAPVLVWHDKDKCIEIWAHRSIYENPM